MQDEFEEVCNKMHVNERLAMLEEAAPSMEPDDLVVSTVVRLKEYERSRYEEHTEQVSYRLSILSVRQTIHQCIAIVTTCFV